MFVFGFARDAKTRRPVGANFLEAVQVLGVVVLILSILRLFCLWLCQKLQNANYFWAIFSWGTCSDTHKVCMSGLCICRKVIRIVWTVLCAVQLRNCPLVGPAGGPSAQSGGNVAIQKLSRNILFYHVQFTVFNPPPCSVLKKGERTNSKFPSFWWRTPWSSSSGWLKAVFKRYKEYKDMVFMFANTFE